MSDERAVEAPPSSELAELTRRYVDLASPRLGSTVTFATDDFFADKSRLIDPKTPVFFPLRYDDHGKWMDGWESRRRRGEGHDWVTVRLGERGRVRKVDVDTSFFTGNFAPQVMLEGCDNTALGDGTGDDAQWFPLVDRCDVVGDGHNLIACADDAPPVTHLRFHIYPDGGVARLRVFGEVATDWTRYQADELVDLVAIQHGGRAVEWSDAHYGHPVQMLYPDRGRDMGDGWETARRRGPGNDWVILALGHAGRLRTAIIDTAHFKGNYPDRCTLRGARLGESASADDLVTASEGWELLLPESKLGADQEHSFALNDADHVDYVRLDIFPDGGISRVRLLGNIG